GQTIPLYGQGSSHLHGPGRGDLVIHVTVETPVKLEPEQEELLRQLAMLRGEESPPGRSRQGSRGSFPRLRVASTAGEARAWPRARGGSGRGPRRCSSATASSSAVTASR